MKRTPTTVIDGPHIRRQSYLTNARGTRQRRRKYSAAVMARLERDVEHTARRFGVSRSLVIATALADFFGRPNVDSDAIVVDTK